MMEEKWMEKYCYEVFNDSEWSILLRSRCNAHAGEPDMKVWICQYGKEVAQLSSKYRGYGRFMNMPGLIPDEVMKKAKKTWNELCEGYYTCEKLAELREKFFAVHNRGGQFAPMVATTA